MIYKLNNKEIRQKMREFGKTNYGRSIFIICYFPFIFFLILSLVFLFNFKNNNFFIIILLFFILSSIISFSLGNYAYYRELRLFVNK